MCGLKTAAIVSASWLKTQLTAPQRQLKIFDATWGFKKNGFEDYILKHIPSAVFFDHNQCVEPTRYTPRALPDTQCFSKYAKELGINQDSHLVFYDQDAAIPSSRAWWLFRAFGHEYVSVLNGGMNQWIREGNETESGENIPQEDGNFEAVYNEDMIVNYKKIQDIIINGSSQILDTRNPANFRGEADEPSPSTIIALESSNNPLPQRMARGHLPGAINFNVSHIIDPETRTFRSPEEVEQGFNSQGIDLTKPITSMCYNGMMATLCSVAAAHIGKQDYSVYYGSWTEFGQRAAEDNLLVKPGNKTGA